MHEVRGILQAILATIGVDKLSERCHSADVIDRVSARCAQALADGPGRNAFLDFAEDRAHPPFRVAT